MGICQSDGKVLPQNISKNTYQKLNKLNINQKVIDILWTTFCKIDRSSSNSLSLDEFLRFYGMEENNFTRKIFSRMDHDKLGHLDFEEYAISVWDFLTLDLNQFVFHLYDIDDSKTLLKSELDDILKTVYGANPGENKTTDKKIMKMDSNVDGKVDFVEFCGFLKTENSFAFPAFTIQQELMNRNGGQDMWISLREQRHLAHKDENLVHKLLLQRNKEKDKK